MFPGSRHLFCEIYISCAVHLRVQKINYIYWNKADFLKFTLSAKEQQDKRIRTIELMIHLKVFLS